MFRNQYDSDAITWSPQGRLHQVEYALEAIKQGSATVGLVSKTHAVVCALKRNAEEMSSYQKKLIRIDDHLAIAVAGLAPDARVLGNFMRQQAMISKATFNRPVPVGRVVNAIADKAQVATQEYGRRPYGVGLLVIGADETGPHLFEFQPSGTALEYLATSMGARSQSARTYLERNFEQFADAAWEELALHGLRALRDTLPQDKELTTANVSLAVVGRDMKLRMYDDGEMRQWLEQLGDTGARRSTGAAAAGPADAPADAAADAPAETTEATTDSTDVMQTD